MHYRGFLFATMLLAPTLVAANPNPANEVLRGWLSDAGCAKGRAAEGVYTATSQRCAKECVARGKKIVLIDPEHKAIVEIANQDAVKNNVGDYVELTGVADSKNTLHVDALKFLDKNRAMCGVPDKKDDAKKE
jgi:hypothetical protein